MATKISSIIAVSLLIIMFTGCQKNSYQSCIDFQTDAATRAYKKEATQSFSALQEATHSHTMSHLSRFFYHK